VGLGPQAVVNGGETNAVGRAVDCETDTGTSQRNGRDFSLPLVQRDQLPGAV